MLARVHGLGNEFHLTLVNVDKVLRPNGVTGNVIL